MNTVKENNGDVKRKRTDDNNDGETWKKVSENGISVDADVYQKVSARQLCLIYLPTQRSMNSNISARVDWENDYEDEEAEDKRQGRVDNDSSVKGNERSWSE